MYKEFNQDKKAYESQARGTMISLYPVKICVTNYHVIDNK